MLISYKYLAVGQVFEHDKSLWICAGNYSVSIHKQTLTKEFKPNCLVESKRSTKGNLIFWTLKNESIGKVLCTQR